VQCSYKVATLQGEKIIRAGMFDWDGANIRHIAEHDVTPEEAEQVISNDSLEITPPRVQNGELRFMHLGETDGGRVLFVILTEVNDVVRVVTAFDAKPKWRRYYAVQRRRQYGKEA
jgi:uncharacterized protein